MKWHRNSGRDGRSGIGKIFLISLGVMVLLSLCTTGAALAAGTLERVQQSGEVRAVVVVGEEPGFIKDANSGQWSGYFWDIYTVVADAMKIKLVPVESTWGNMTMDLQSGKADMVVGPNPHPQRSLVMDYTFQPVFTNNYVVVGKKRVKTWAEINKPSVRIGVEIGSSHEMIATRFAPKAEIVRFRNRDESLLALESGRVDLITNTLFNSMIMTKRRPELGLVSVPAPLATSPVCFGVAREAGDKGWLMFLSVTSWNLQTTGYSHAAILRYLERYGLSTNDIPPGASF